MRAFLLFALLGAGACVQPTRFNGDPHFPGGPPACFSQCEEDGLEMAGFVYSGEFASSCVCRPKASPSAPGASPGSPPPAASAEPLEPAIAAAVDLAIAAQAEAQRQADAAQRQRSSTSYHPTNPAGDPLASRGPSDAVASESVSAQQLLSTRSP